MACRLKQETRDFEARVRDLISNYCDDILQTEVPRGCVSTTFRDRAAIVKAIVKSKTVRAVVKEIPVRKNFCSPTEFATIHVTICRRGDRWADILPAVRFVDDSRGLIVFEYVAGESQYDLCRRVLSPRPTETHFADLLPAMIRKTAVTFRTLHSLNGDNVGLPYQSRTNRSWMSSLESLWGTDCVRGIVPNAFPTPERLFTCLKSTDENFESRCVNAVLTGDAQPGNVVVTPQETVRLIDLAYKVGNPAIDIGSYLVGLDTIGLRYPRPRTLKIIASWKREFVNAYLSESTRCTAEEVALFYIRAILRHFVRHWQAMPVLRWYVKRYYRRILTGVLEGVLLSQKADSNKNKNKNNHLQMFGA